MNAILNQATILEGVAQFGLSWLVQSTLLIGMGLIVGWLQRRRGSAVQSAIYRTTLVAVLLCPLVAQSLAAVGVPGLYMDFGPMWQARNAPEAASRADARPKVEVDGTASGTIASLPPYSADAANAISVDTPPTVSRVRAPADTSPSLATGVSGMAEAVARELAMRPYRWLLGTLALAWLAGAVVLLMRIAGAWHQLARIRRSAVDVDSATQAVCRDVASLLRIAPPDVKHSPYLPSPCLVGLRRPAVLLPEAFQAMQLRDVLIHELAHLQRRDCYWKLVARLATAVFFFQPLLWKLLRRLDATAEEVCDDYVMQLGGDRQQYAHRLVDIAELSTTPVAVAVVGMVSLKSMLARRVARITDTSRRFSTRVSTLSLVMVLAGGAVFTAAAGLLGVESSTPSEYVAAEEDTPPTKAGLLTVRGHVVDSNGRAVSDARVAAIGRSLRAERGGDLPPRDEVLAETTTGQDGQFVMTIANRVSSKTHRYARVIARGDGLGLGGRRLNLDLADATTTIELLEEQVIRGRLVNPKGQPADKVRLLVKAVLPQVKGDEYLARPRWHNFVQVPAAWPPSVVSDDEGRFEVRGIPVGAGVSLDLADNDRYSTSGLTLNTAEPEQREEHDGTYRSQIKDAAPGEERTLTLAPARFFEGVVRYEDTNEPAPHARLTIWASQQERLGSMISVAGTADGNGRYRIRPKPGVRFGINAYPANDEPYLIREIRDIRWDGDAMVQQVDVTLPRGVLVQGKIVESGSEAPIAGASVQYVPETANNSHIADDIVTGWQGIQVTDDQGEFRVAVLPGPGRLIAHGPRNEYVLQESSSGELDRGKPGGDHVYAHAIRKLDPDEEADPLELTLTLERSLMVTGELVDEHGSPVDDALLISRLAIRDAWLIWQCIPQSVMDGRFQVAGLAPGEACPIHFLDPKRRSGASVIARAGDDPMRVTLKPCGQVTMRIVDPAGKPIADHTPDVAMIFTPGASQYDPHRSRPEDLWANTDYIMNVDRLNHWDRRSTDAEGRITFPALIPGATYHVVVIREGIGAVAKTFETKANQTLDLGDIVSERAWR